MDQAEVIDLNDKRKRRVPVVISQPSVPPPDDPYLFCIDCYGDQFWIFANGTIKCSKCNSRIRNLTVQLGEPK